MSLPFRRLPFLLTCILALGLGDGYVQTAEPPPQETVFGRPVTARAWNALGTKYAREDELVAALDAFNQGLRLEPANADLLLKRGLIYFQQKDWARAEHAFTETITADHENTRAYWQRALARVELAKLDDAYRDASRAARMEPENPQPVFIRYYLCHATGRHELGHTAGMTYIGIQGWKDQWSPYMALLNYVALRRSGDEAAARDMLAEAVAMLSPDTWPYAVLIYLRGSLTAETLLALATEREHATVARYYVGMQHWLAGEVEAAKTQFTWVTTQGDEAFLQHRLAKDHLAEIGRGVAASVSKE